MKYVDYSGLYRILANLKAWIKSVFVSNVTVSGRTISVTKNDQTTSTDLSYPAASAEAAGVLKLYSGMGSNTDGTVTQNAITTLLQDGYEFKGLADPAATIPAQTSVQGVPVRKQFWLAVEPGDYTCGSSTLSLSIGEIGVILCSDAGAFSIAKESLTFPAATTAVSGIMKLYTTLGNSTDGTITRNAMTILERFGYRFNGETTPSSFTTDIAVTATGDFIPQFFLAKTAGTYEYDASHSVTLAAGEVAIVAVNGPSISVSKYTIFDVAQTTGSSTTKLMSQKAITDAINEIITTTSHGYVFSSIISPTSMPDLTGLDDDDKVYFIGTTAGTYTFRQVDSFTLSDGEVGFFYYTNDVITMQKVDLAKGSDLAALGMSVSAIAARINNGALYKGMAPSTASYPSGVEGQEYVYLAGPGAYTGYDQQTVTVPANRCALLYLRGANDGGMELLPVISTSAIVTNANYSGSATYSDDQVLSANAVQSKFFQKANIITNAGAGISGSNDQVPSDKEINARLAQIRQEMAQIGGFSTAYSTLAALETAAEAGQLDARKIYLIPLDEEGPTDVYAEYILMTASGQLYKCDECGYIYNPDKGDPNHGVPPGTAFTDLPNDWVCPECENTTDNFTPVAGYVERIGSTSLDMEAITNAEIDQAFVDNGMVPAS